MPTWHSPSHSGVHANDTNRLTMVDFCAAEFIPSRAPVELELAVVVATTIPTKLANQLIKALCAASPLNEFKHLKRVRRTDRSSTVSTLDVILCSLTDLTGAVAKGGCIREDHSSMPETLVIENLPASIAKIVTEHQLQPSMMHVPRHAPQTREQWSDWCKIWPITWKVPEQSSQLAASLSTAEQQYFEQHMAAALELASEHCSCNAALIVDPATNGLVAKAINSLSHPLDHAVMVAIRHAAQRDKELWQTPRVTAVSQALANAGAPASESRDGAACNPPETSQQQHQHTENRLAEEDNEGDCCASQGCLKRPRLLEAPPVEATQQVQQQECRLGQLGAGATGSSQGNAEAKDSGSIDDPGARPYMCTSYDCFMVREPCIMCAMALVHSRLSRVVYCHKDAEHGALGSRCRLHAQRSLNHHYQVYRLALKEDAVAGGCS